MKERARNLDIATTIEFMENSINAGNPAFFVMTDLGRVAVEVTYEDYDQMNPVEIYEWRMAPETRWCRVNRRSNANYYISFGMPTAEVGRLWVHIRVVEAVMKLILLNTTKVEPNQAVTDAAVMSYLEHVEHRNVTMNFMEHEFARLNLKFLIRQDLMVQNLVRGMIENRRENAVRALSDATAIASQKISMSMFEDQFNVDIVSLIAAMRLTIPAVQPIIDVCVW